MSNYLKWTDVIDQICGCDIIASSSLHGLIVAVAYGIPFVWTESKHLIGGHFKFHDFFQSLGFDIDNPMLITPKTTIEEILKSRITKAPEFNLEPLIKACPFKLKNI